MRSQLSISSDINLKHYLIRDSGPEKTCAVTADSALEQPKDTNN
ncbi:MULTISPECIES: hypothetical protein [unclassified Microcoleus]|nr:MULTISPECIES: hypothetical protein [unclassified Microcoleus]